jgi:putative intracellular protease/amidase
MEFAYRIAIGGYTQEKSIMNNHILMLVTSHNQIPGHKATGIWFEEFAIPYNLFREQGYSITVASPQGGSAPIDPSSTPAGEHRITYAEALGRLQDTLPLSEVQVEDYAAIFLPGGHGTMFDLPVAAVGQVIGFFADADKVIGAVCHGPAGLVEARLADGTPVVTGKRVTGFTNAEEAAAQLTDHMPFLLETRLAELGASFVAGALWADHVEVDGKLVTGQNPQSSTSAAQAVLNLLQPVVASS